MAAGRRAGTAAAAGRKAGGGGEPRPDQVRRGLDRPGTVAWKTGTGSTLEPVGAGTDGRVYDLVYAPGGGLTVVDGELTGAYRRCG